MGKINDFGKVIEGARKDLWKSRGLMVEDTTGMTDLEKEKYVTKDNIWIKPDVNQLLEVFPREIVYWKMEMRKLVAAKPMQITIEEYIEGVRTIRDMVAHVTTEAEIYAFASEAKNGKLLIQTGRYQYDYVKPYRNILKGNAFLRLNTEYGLRQMKRKMDEKNFGLNENAIMQKDYPILYVDGDKIGIGLDRGRKMLVQSVPTGKYFFYPQEGISLDDVEEKYVLLNKMRRIIFVGTTSDECEAERKTIFEQQSSEKGNKERPNKKKKWIPKQFENLKRIGNEQHFPGHQVTGEEIIEIFGIRGGQFGNWTNNLERQHSLNYTFDAFADLAEVLGIERTSISLPGLSKIIVRGEAVISYKEFEKINESLNADEQYMNPRNLASGTIRLLDSKKSAERNVHFKAFTFVNALDYCNTYDDALKSLQQWGFETVDYQLVSPENVVEAVGKFEEMIRNNPYPSDGLVLTFNDIAYGNSLGTTGKFPRDSIAFKWQDTTAETTLKGIEWSASRTGLINPVAIFDTVELEGTAVSRASLHNISYMRDLKLGIGDTITVYKANKIIPQIDENLTKGSHPIIPIPEECPVCGSTVTL